MKQKLIPYLKNLFSGVNHTVVIIAIVISFGLWYLLKLGHTYTATVVLPVTVVNSPGSTVGVLENENEVECRIQGTGYELLNYRVRRKSYRVEIDLGRVVLRAVEGTNRSEILFSSLSNFNAIAEQLTEGQLQAILTPRIEVTTAPFNTRKVPIRSRMDFEFRNQYMPVGPIVFSPDSIEVKSLDFLLDTLQAVYTEYRQFSNVKSPIGGNIALQPMTDVLYPIDEVSFALTVEEYTEIDRKLPLSLRNGPEDRMAVILPGEVQVRLNVARSKYTSLASDEIRAYIDYEDRLTNVGKQYKVYVPVPDGIVVKEVSPLYVELIFEGP